jgi:hypothetical protein
MVAPYGSICQPLQEALPVIIVTGNDAAFHPSPHDVINQSRNMYSCLPRHFFCLPLSNFPTSINTLHKFLMTSML